MIAKISSEVESRGLSMSVQPEQHVHYVDFAYWQRHKEDSFGSQLSRIEESFEGPSVPTLALPLDNP
jgi:hypothetical protein